jgi:hypothetical protein
MKKMMLCIFVLSFSGCLHYPQLSEPLQKNLISQYTTQIVALKQSCYFGSLYDENEKYLLSPSAFRNISHIVGLDGAPIHPNNQLGIIPAGTLFQIKRIAFPSFFTSFERMLTTPRYNPWVYLEPLEQNNPHLPTKYPYIVLLPLDIETEADFHASLFDMLGPKNEVLAWLTQRKASVRSAIEFKEALTGMNRDELIAALGTPKHWLSATSEIGNAEIAWYPEQEVWLINNVVLEIRKARSLYNAPRVSLEDAIDNRHLN